MYLDNERSLNMLEFGATEVYRLGGVSRISKAGKYRVKKVLNDPTNKHYLIVGVFDPKDVSRVGEILAVVRPENPKLTYYQSWDVFSLGRSGQDSADSIACSRDTIESIRLGNSVAIKSFTTSWSAIGSNPLAIEYFSQLLSGYSSKLLGARTISRIHAGEVLSDVIDLKDSRGRYNPGAKSAQLVMTDRLLRDQLTFDALSLHSARNRAGFGGLVLDTFKQELVWLDRLLSFGRSSTVAQQFERSSELYHCNPFGYGLKVINHNGYLNSLDSLVARNKIRRTMFLEDLLGEFSNTLSLVKNKEVRDLRPKIISDLESMLPISGPSRVYTELLNLLRADLAELGDIIASDDGPALLRKISQTKKHLRRREANTSGWPI